MDFVISRSPPPNRNKKMPGIIETTEAKPTAANGNRSLRAIGTSTIPTKRQASPLAAALLSSKCDMAQYRTACAPMPITTGYTNICAGMVKKMLYAAAATPAHRTSIQIGGELGATSGGRV